MLYLQASSRSKLVDSNPPLTSDSDLNLHRLTLLQGTQPRLRMQAFETETVNRAVVESYISRVFEQHHQAKLTTFMPLFLAASHNASNLEGVPESLTCAVGVNLCLEEDTYLEQYLDDTIERCVSRISAEEVSRKQIAEVGNLASTSLGTCRSLFVLLVHFFARLEVEWAVCTGTAAVRSSLRRAGIAHQVIKKASPNRLRDFQSDWGTYYRHSPHVMAIHIPSALQKLDPRLALVWE